MNVRTQKRARASEGSRARASPSQALEGARVEGCSRQKSPKSGDFAAALPPACGTPRFRVPTPYLSGKRGALGPVQRAAFGCTLTWLHQGRAGPEAEGRSVLTSEGRAGG